jgi:hypothetical protein
MESNTIIVAISSVSREFEEFTGHDGKAHRMPTRFNFEVKPIEGNPTLDYVSNAQKDGQKFKLVPIEDN